MYKKYLIRDSYAHSEPLASPFNSLPKLRFFLQTCLWLLVILMGSGPSQAQQPLDKTITVHFENENIDASLKKIAAQANVRFVYDDRILKKSVRITGTYRAPLKAVLQQVLTPHQISFEVVDNQFIVLRTIPSQETRQAVSPVNAPASVSEGFVQMIRVVDERGDAMSGVSISMPKYNRVGQTNEKGMYNTGVPKDDAVFVITHIGYKKEQIASNRNKDVTIQLTPDPAHLDEVTVIGYGTTSKRTSTGSSVRVSAAEIANQPVTNPLQALQGRMAGVLITQDNGLPGSSMSISIRGRNSITSNNEPLYIIDGVPYLSTAVNAQAGISINGANGSTSPLNSINPLDIESIDVLKDADATAIYGSRAANGVVLITTKKGREGKTQLDVQVRQGFSQVSHFVPTLSTPEYLTIRRKALENDRLTPAQAGALDLTTWSQTETTDFQKILIGNTARMADVTASLSGGDSRTSFRMSGTYHKETNVFVGNQGYSRFAANVNLNHKTLDQRFTIGFSSVYSADKNNVSILDLTSIAYNLPPNFPLYNPDGSLYWTGVDWGQPYNPLGRLNQTNRNVGTNLISNLNLNYRILEGLNFRTSLGFSRSDLDQVQLNPRSSMDPSLASSQARAAFSYNVSSNYIVEPQLTYDVLIGKGVLNALVGGTWQYKLSKQPFYTSASDFLSDDFIANIASARTISTTSSTNEYKYASAFGRLTYNWENKYILNLNFRRDGSSRFGADSRFGNFGSAGAAWVFSEEPLLKNSPVLSFGKLRGSYGVVGNDGIGDYGFYDSYASINYLYNGVPGLVPTRIANTTYQWERTKKLEAALELGFFENRLSASLAFYRNLTDNQLVSYPLAIQSGFASYQANLPARVENKGWELTLTSANLKRRNFSWTTNLNVSINRNTLLDFPNIQSTSYYNQFQVGKALRGFNVYQYTGIDPATNLASFADLNGNGRINFGYSSTGRGDSYYAGFQGPKFFGGLGNTITYQSWGLDLLFQFVKQQGFDLLRSSFYPPGFQNNFSREAIQAYLNLNGNADAQPEITTGYGNPYAAYSNYTGSDAMLVDASFVRLKNVNLSYQLPASWSKKAGMSTLRLQLQAQNLLTITPYKGFDPESQGLVVPPLRTLVAGIQCVF